MVHQPGPGEEEEWQVEGLYRLHNLNQACPKDSFPLPRIDQIVDTTAGHQLLSFMDIYFRYNQIKMHTPDEDKKVFIIDQRIYCYKVMPLGMKNARATYQ